MSETNARTLGGLTTYKQFYELGVELPTVQKKQARGVNYKTKLGPYNPIATCNRKLHAGHLGLMMCAVGCQFELGVWFVSVVCQR